MTVATAGVRVDGRGATRRRGAEDATRRVRTWTPPVHRREFWGVQALVLVIAGAHGIIESQQLMPETGPMYFVPVSLFFVPVVYAAVNFGLRGSAPTAIWCALVTLPNLILWNEGVQQAGELWQIATVVIIGFFVGNRVDRETHARREAEARARAHRAAEERYRSLFDHVADAILLIDEHGVVEEANDAAEHLFGHVEAGLVGTPFASVAGPEIVAAVGGGDAAHAVHLADGDTSRWVEPVSTRLDTAEGDVRTQLVLRDVTLGYERERQLEDYTRQTLAAREEERRRIAHDLHDGPVQSLVLLVRSLDRVGLHTSGEGSVAVRHAREVAEGVASELRRFSRELRPSILDDLGLPAALKAELEALAGRSGLRGEFQVRGGVRRLSPDLEVTLLRIEQEALHNVERHAAAATARVSLSYRGGTVRLAIEDDGCGIGAIPSATRLLRDGRMGVVGMQERARFAGASLSIGNGPMGGTVVEVVVPG